VTYEIWLLFISSFVASTLLPGGSEVGLAWLVSQGQIPLWKLLAAAISGNSLGGILTFITGWYIGAVYPAKMLNSPWQHKAKKWLSKYGFSVLLFSWLPIVGDPLCLIAGWLRLNLSMSCLFILLGKAARYLIIAVTFS
jgi:membrane protein YqaA with SNARE-associated domain